MRRRKLLIGIGAAAAGGSAAFGTEAFTSVQAERNVEVAGAGDRSSFVAIQPLDSANVGKYLDAESDNTVELDLDGDNSGSGPAKVVSSNNDSMRFILASCEEDKFMISQPSWSSLNPRQANSDCSARK